MVGSENYLLSIAECRDGEESLKSLGGGVRFLFFGVFFFGFVWRESGCATVVLGLPGRSLRKQTDGDAQFFPARILVPRH